MILSEAKTATRQPFLFFFFWFLKPSGEANSVRAHHYALMNSQNWQNQQCYGARIHVQARVGGVLIETV